MLPARPRLDLVINTDVPVARQLRSRVRPTRSQPERLLSELRLPFSTKLFNRMFEQQTISSLSRQGSTTLQLLDTDHRLPRLRSMPQPMPNFEL